MPVVASSVQLPVGDLVHHTWSPGPGDPLAPFVEAIVDCDGVVLHPRERLFPSGAVNLVVHLDEPYRLLTPRGAERYPTVCVTGVLSAPVVMEAPPVRSRIVAIRLHPAGARALLARPLSEVGGRTVDVHDILGPATSELAERCHEGRSATGRIAIARRWLARRLRGFGRDGELVAWAISSIVRDHGARSIDALRERTGLSWARLAAAFRDQVGVTPKRYARIVRFRHALELADASPDLPLSALALAAGYYDQAHMNADFRALAGITPGALRSSVLYPDAVSIAEMRP